MRYQPRSWAAALCAVAVLANPATAQEATQQSAEKPAEQAAKKATGKKAIDAALKKKVDAQLILFPLRQFAGWVEQHSGIQVEVDQRCLQDTGLDPNAIEIDLDMTNVTLASVLYHALRPHELTYVLQNDVLMITKLDAAHGIVEVEIYPATDLVTFRGPDGKMREDYDALIELVMLKCAPTTWHYVGGAGAINGFDGNLVVSQNREVHKHIAGLLAMLRSAISVQAENEVTPQGIRNSLSDDAAVLTALETPRPTRLVQVPLTEFAGTLEQEYAIQVAIDHRALLDAGLDVETIEFSCDYKSAPLRSNLPRLLRQHDLACVVDHEVLVVTTTDRASTFLETQAYPIADLLSAGIDADESPAQHAGKLEAALSASVDALSWDHNGGNSHMTFAAPWNLLVVSATAPTQRKIAATLDQLREARRRQTEQNLAPTEVPAVEDPIELRVFAIPAATDAAIDANSDAAEEVARLVLDLVPETRSTPATSAAASAVATEAPYLRVAANRLVVRHRRSVLAKVESLLKQLESPSTPPAR